MQRFISGAGFHFGTEIVFDGNGHVFFAVGGGPLVLLDPRLSRKHPSTVGEARRRTNQMFFLQPIDVYVNHERVAFADQQPTIESSRVLVPVRGVFEKMGALVEWTPIVTAVTIDKGTMHMELSIADRTVTVNGATRELDQGVKVVNGRMMVPLRFISETLGAHVRWDADKRTVHITMPQGPPPPPR